MNKRESLNSVFYPLGTFVVIGIILFVLTVVSAVIKMADDKKTIEKLERDKLYLILDSSCNKNKRRN